MRAVYGCRFRRAIELRALWMAEDAARELRNLPLEYALQLVHLYAGRGSPKYEKAALPALARAAPHGRLAAAAARAEVASDLVRREA